MKIRIGNDFKTKWAITWLGEPEDFSDATDISLSFNIYDKKIELTKDVDYTITDNIIEIDVTPDICNILGVYNLKLHYTKPNNDFIDGERRSAVDIDAFRIVGKSDKADATQDVSIISDAVAIFLDIAYKKLEEIEANEDVRIANEGEREDAEDIRVSNEDTRIAEEETRILNESIRDSSETVRVQNESVRVTEESVRQNNESVRISEESVRQNNESVRISEESVRQNNEANRISAETLRVQAEDEREVSEGERVASEGVRVSNENTRISNEQDRQTNTTTAISNAEQATLNANNSAVYANEQGSYAEEMSSHPPTIINDYWHIWNFTTNQYETTGQYARGDSAVEGALVVQTTGQSAVNTMSQKAITDELALKANQTDLVQLAGEVSLLDAVQGAKIKDIENVISTMNPNQSAQLSMSGRKVVSLPKNAANGGMSVKLEGITAENVIANGDFRNGTTGWDTGGRGTVSIVGGYLNVMSNGTSNNVYARNITTMPLVTGDKIYSMMEARVTNSVAVSLAIQYDGSTGGGVTPINSISPLTINTWYNMSGITTIPSGYSGVLRLYLYAAYPTAAGGNGLSHEIKRAITINLTKVFGVGNEPDLATCDKMFSSYFEGVKSFVPTGRVRSVGKNLFDGKWVMGAISLNGDFIPSINEIRSVTPIKVSSLKNYIGLNTTNTPVYTYYSSETVFNSTTLLLRTTAQAHTPPAGAKVCILKINSRDLNYKFQYGVGTVASPYEPYKETSLYLTAPELRSNGLVKDEIRKGANGYELVKRISDDKQITSAMVISLTTTLTNVDLVLLDIKGTFDNVKAIDGYLGWIKIKGSFEVTIPNRDNVSSVGGFHVGTGSQAGNVYFIVAKNKYANVNAAKAGLISDYALSTLYYEFATPVITPISYGGVLNSAENGTVYHEPVIADAGVYGTNMPILLTDYPISALEEIIKHENGVDTYLDVSTAVIAGDKLSFTHPSLQSGDLVLFTYAFAKETTNGNITATFYDSNVVKIDTVTGKAYKITDVVTNGVLTRTLTEV